MFFGKSKLAHTFCGDLLLRCVRVYSAGSAMVVVLCWRFAKAAVPHVVDDRKTAVGGLLLAVCACVRYWAGSDGRCSRAAAVRAFSVPTVPSWEVPLMRAWARGFASNLPVLLYWSSLALYNSSPPWPSRSSSACVFSRYCWLPCTLRLYSLLYNKNQKYQDIQRNVNKTQQ